MTNDGGPWGKANAPAPAPPARSRLSLRLLLLAGVVGMVVALARAFPGAVSAPDDWASVGYKIGLVALVSAGVFRAGHGGFAQHLRHAAIWAAIIGVLALGFAYRDEFTGLWRHLKVAFSAGDPVATGAHELVIPQDDSGAFVLIGKVNGERVRFLVDTGATDTVLSPDDVRRLGVDPASLQYDHGAETANGLGYGASFVANRLEVGPVRVDNFRMTVNQAPMSHSLLGLTFLNRLESFEVRGRNLILRWRDGA